MSLFKSRSNAGVLGAAFTAVFALCAFTGVAHAAEAGQQSGKAWQTGLHRTDLVRRDLGVADREVIQVRVDFEPGVAAPKHSHPGVEIAYVISGQFQYQLEGQPPVTLNTGDSLYIPAGTAHTAKNIGASTGSELATYIVQKGSPLVVLEK